MKRGLLIAAVPAALLALAIAPPRAWALYAETSDCMLGFEDNYEFGATVCVTGELDKKPPGSICPEAWLYAVAPGGDPSVSQVAAAYVPNACGGGGAFYDIELWVGALGGDWEVVIDQYPFIDSNVPFDPALDMRGIMFHVAGGASSSSGAGGAGGAGGASGAGGAGGAGDPPECPTQSGMLCGGVEAPPSPSPVPSGSLEVSLESPEVDCANDGSIKGSFKMTYEHESGSDCPCSTVAENKGSIEVELEVCNRSGGLSGTIGGKYGYYNTPQCFNDMWTCVPPSCQVDEFTAEGQGKVAMTWPLGQLYPPLAPFLNNGVVETSVGIDFAVGVSSTRKLSDGAGSQWGCCDMPGSKNEQSLSGLIKGGINGKLEVELGILSGEGSVEGKICFKPTLTNTSGCGATPTNEWSKEWFVGACVNGQLCVGGGWLKYCRSSEICPVKLGSEDACE